jgi:hypothetical protein
MRSVEKTPSERTIAPVAKTATIGSGAPAVEIAAVEIATGVAIGVAMGVAMGVGDWAARVVTPSSSPIRMERESCISV